MNTIDIINRGVDASGAPLDEESRTALVCAMQIVLNDPTKVEDKLYVEAFTEEMVNMTRIDYEEGKNIAEHVVNELLLEAMN